MIIRFARLHEVDEIAALWEQMVKELVPDYTPNVGWWKAMCEKLLKTEVYHLLTAVEENTGRIIGFLDGFLYPEPSTGLLHAVGQHFYVLPEHRNTTVATRLYREALKMARCEGAKVFEFFCFQKEIPFWQKKGYSPVRTMMRRPCV